MLLQRHRSGPDGKWLENDIVINGEPALVAMKLIKYALRLM